MLAVFIIIMILFGFLLLSYYSHYDDSDYDPNRYNDESFYGINLKSYNEGFDNTCKPGCTAPTKKTSNCIPIPITTNDPTWIKNEDNPNKIYWYNKTDPSIITYQQPKQLVDNTKSICPWNCTDFSLSGTDGKCMYDTECEVCSPQTIYDSNTIIGYLHSEHNGNTGDMSGYYFYTTEPVDSGNTGGSNTGGSNTSDGNTDETDEYNYTNGSNYTGGDTGGNYNHYTDKPTHEYGYDPDNYILKSSIVPAICPACPNILYPDANAFDDTNKISQSNTGQSNTGQSNTAQSNTGQSTTSQTNTTPQSNTAQCNTSSSKEFCPNNFTYPNVPYPILPDFTTFGI